MDRNLPTAHAALGQAKSFIDRAEETEPHVQEALRLSPKDRIAFLWFLYVAAAKWQLGKQNEALTWCRRSIEANRNHPTVHFFLGSILQCLGREDEARASVETGLALNPGFTIRRFKAGMPSNYPGFVAGYQRALGAMREAGVPEG